MNMKVCDRCGKVFKPVDIQHRLSITRSISFGYFPVTPIRSIDLCKRCFDDTIKFLAKAPKDVIIKDCAGVLMEEGEEDEEQQDQEGGV